MALERTENLEVQLNCPCRVTSARMELVLLEELTERRVLLESDAPVILDGFTNALVGDTACVVLASRSE